MNTPKTPVVGTAEWTVHNHHLLVTYVLHGILIAAAAVGDCAQCEVKYSAFGENLTQCREIIQRKHKESMEET